MDALKRLQHVTRSGMMHASHRLLAWHVKPAATMPAAHRCWTATYIVRATGTLQEAHNLPQERGITFQPGCSFYRPQSTFSRDLAVLSLIAYRQGRGGGPVSVLDLMAGSGIRGMRYLQHAGAETVWCNDISTEQHSALVANLSAALAAARPAEQAAERLQAACCTELPRPVETRLPLLESAAWDWQGAQTAAEESLAGGQEPRVMLLHEDACRLLSWCGLQRQYFDLIDIDSFGGVTSFVGPALGALRYEGLLCLTSTAGPMAGGRDPSSGLSLYGAHLAPVPYANEQGLRMLLGVACREALARGLRLTPLWSTYAPHGPVFRVMLRVSKAGKGDTLRMQEQFGFVLYDTASGGSEVVRWGELAAATARAQPATALLSGPIWVGPLQDASHLSQLLALAGERGWAGRDSCAAALPWTKKGGVRSLGELLRLLLGESDPQLPPWFFFMNDISKHGRLRQPPPRDALISALQARGYSACATHIDSKALRTNATMAEAAAVCVQDLGIPLAG